MPALQYDYRRILSENVAALLEHHGLNSDTAKAIYLDGTKKGKHVSPRSIRNLLNQKGNTPGMDIVAALAARLGVAPWQLLVSQLKPTQPPQLALTQAQHDLYDKFERLMAEARGETREENV